VPLNVSTYLVKLAARAALVDSESAASHRTKRSGSHRAQNLTGREMLIRPSPDQIAQSGAAASRRIGLAA
jgi:hypothetical protein